MGKTESGAVWLDKDLLSSFDYWQFWRNTEDSDVIKYLKLFTEMSDEEINKLSSLQGSEINEAKIVLANEATAMLHGKAEAEKASVTAKKTFDEKGYDENLPTTEMKKSAVEKGVSLKEVILDIGFASSNSDYKRNFQNSAYKIENKTISDENYIITIKDFEKDTIKISFGKKKHHLIKII
jgi:tyrosyl-tRNA synthetase